jgi:GlpG protein
VFVANVVYPGTALGWVWVPAAAIWHGQVWGLVTSAFVHLDPVHLALNVYWLWVLGRPVERLLGPWRTLAFVAGTAWLSSAAQLAVSDTTGIGFSGVGYALISFVWMLGRRRPELAVPLPQNAVGLFLVWGIGCWVATVAGVANVGNAAHLVGFVVGAAVGVAVGGERRMWAVLAVALCASIGSLAYAPWSAGWTAMRAYDAHVREDYPAAIAGYERTLARGSDPAWVYPNLVAAQLAAGDRGGAQTSLERLRAIDAAAAAELDPYFAPSEP